MGSSVPIPIPPIGVAAGIQIGRSEQINEFAAALAKAQSEMTVAKRDGKSAHFGPYATLNASVGASRPALTKNGLAVTQIPWHGGNQVFLTTIVLHSSGQFMSGTVPVVPAKNDAQGIGAALSYMKRYSYNAIVGIVEEGEEVGDDSPNRSHHPNKPRAQARQAGADVSVGRPGNSAPAPAAKLLGSNAESAENPGAYICPVGYSRGQALKDIPLAKLIASVDHYEKKRTEGAILPPMEIDFLNNAKRFLEHAQMKERTPSPEVKS